MIDHRKRIESVNYLCSTGRLTLFNNLYNFDVFHFISENIR
ncbi:hypothetical protein Tsp_06792 [Trichinella spiralis]|nr:hypothetical protein Tsp_06792 [Trichinella spiralis]